jgi:pentatricopeptide repeat protein
MIVKQDLKVLLINVGFNTFSQREDLEKAKTMFKEMDLQWDLDEVAKLN